jgi:folate-binding protein YgfZ
VLAGFPTLGSEIGERTLPQEVRYDDIGGVSYDKGCYVGQETVARIHFRGHPNWVLRGLEPIDSATQADGDDEALTADGKTVGRITTIVAPDGTPRFGLASVRKEIEVGAELASGFGPVRVVALPFPKPV